MKTIHLAIVTPKGLIYEGDVLEVYVPSTKGPMGILPGHTPLVAPLADAGVLRLKNLERETSYYAIRHGVVEIEEHRTLVLSNVAELAESKEDALAKLKGE